MISASALENTTDTTDGNGLTPHSIAPIVYTDGTITAQDLGHAIYYGKPASIPTYGSHTAAFVDDMGEARTVKYTPVAAVNVYVNLTLTRGVGYVGDSQFKDDLVAALTATHKPGDDSVMLKIVAAALAAVGVDDVTAYTQNSTGSPSTANLAISPFQIAAYSAARITIS
jgi:hypothetical protein